jgi:outer membrane protein TolC
MAAAPVQGDPTLEELIAEALQNSPEIKASQARIEAARFRITQAGSLPDPMIMVGYQNEGFDSYTYGEMEGAQWMFSASQQFLFPGKRSLREEMTQRDTEGLEAMHEQLKLKTAARVRELYYDLFLAHKNIDLLKEKQDLIARMESVALARYAAGTAMQQDVIMTQTEKYMLLEKEEMGRQKIQSLEAMLKAVIGRHQDDQLPKPTEPVYQPFSSDNNEIIKLALQNSPEIKSRHKMLEAANAKVAMARKEYYPDFALSGSYYNRSGDFDDMWAATVAFNIPIYFQSKQKPAEMEAKAGVSQAGHELTAAQLMIEAALRDNFAMLRSSERLMEIYKQGILPKTRQDIEQTLTGYSAGRGEAVNILARLKTLLDYEFLYWSQLVEREKAIVRLQAIANGLNGKGGKQ